MNEQINKQCYIEFKKKAVEIETEKELIKLENQYKRYSECFGSYQPTIKAFFASKYHEFRQKKIKALIKPFVSWKPLKYDLKEKDEKEIEKKIKSIKKSYLKYRFEGLFNLIIDKNNLIYNPLYIRKKILNDLKSFKSLNQFKISNISPFKLKKEYSFLAVKGDCTEGHSKIYFISHGLYVIKTVGNDGIFLKALFIHNKASTLIKKEKTNKIIPPKGEKFNISSIEAYKILDKKDSIRFYGYCNENGLNKANRALLRSIRKMEGGESFSTHLERVEDSLKELEAEYASNPTIELSNGSIIPNYELGNELEKVKLQYWSLTEEHNSDYVPTYIEDY